MFRRFIICLADGARPDVMAEELKEGHLPNIARTLVEPGGHYPAVTTFPSTTGPAYIPLVTGCWPGTANVPGIRWLDRNLYSRWRPTLSRRRSYIGPQSCLLRSDLHLTSPTLFEIFRESYSIFNIVNRGVTPRRNWGGFLRLWYWYYAHLTDHWYLPDLVAGRWLNRLAARDFEFAFFVFPGIDEYSHLIDPLAPRTRTAYRALDRMIGAAAHSLKAAGRLEETCWILVSDHGLSATSRHYPLNQTLEKLGLKSVYYPKIFKWGAQASGMVSGNAMAHVYLKRNDGWGARWSDEELGRDRLRLVDRFLTDPAIDLVLTHAEDGGVVIRSRRGEASVRQENGFFGYRVLGSDPFGYPSMPDRMSADEILARTIDTLYPDGPVQACQIFRSARSGDLILSAAPGSDLRLRFEVPEHRGSHGSLHRDHMRIPLVTNARLAPGPLRSADIFPTILRLAGRSVPEGIDGVARLPR